MMDWCVKEAWYQYRHEASAMLELGLKVEMSSAASITAEPRVMKPW